MILFDFDKTLINKDTLFGFYKIVHGDGLVFKLKRLVLLIYAICYKLKLIDNSNLKAIGIKLFLKGKTKGQLIDASKRYAKQLTLNKLYYDVFLKTPIDKRVIISASPEIYLNEVFPHEKIIGTLLAFKEGEVVGLKDNCYAQNKLERFREKYPNEIVEAVYSDSMTDKPLFDVAKKYHLIKPF